MLGQSCKMLEILDGAKKQFVIPVYQRNYDWKIENCEQLFSDLLDVIKNNRKSHFFGSVVSVNEAGNTVSVIDGQQRLTTVSLLLLAMMNLLEQGIVVSKEDTLHDEIKETYLINKYGSESKRLKLKPIKNDQSAFEALFKTNDHHIKTSNLTANYEFFCNKIQESKVSVDELYEAVGKLEIIDISLQPDDNPQLIFESINSTGLDLSEADKIRNFILMGLTTDLQNEYYEDYWNKIEESTKYDVSTFIRHYLTLKMRTIPVISKVYIEFKKYIFNNNVETLDILKDMTKYANFYNNIIEAKAGDYYTNLCIDRLNSLETTVVYPFLLELLNHYDKSDITLEEMNKVLHTIENYVARRTICEFPTNALNKIFCTLDYDVSRLDGRHESTYANKVNYVLLNKTGIAAFPTDLQVEESIKTKDFYRFQSKNLNYIFDKLENGDSKERIQIIDNPKATIEHIMPQHLTTQWIKDLGEDAEEIHEKWLHKISNLTITCYNSEYSNHSFIDKKTMKDGFDNSGFRINKFISQCDKWTLKELKKRENLLIQKFNETWEMPKTDFESKQIIYEQRDLSTGDFKGNFVISFEFEGIKTKVDSWVDMLVKLTSILYSKDSVKIYQLVESNDDGLASWFSDRELSNKWKKVKDDVYIFGNNNTNTKVSIMNRILKEYKIDSSEVTVELNNIIGKE